MERSILYRKRVVFAIIILMIFMIIIPSPAQRIKKNNILESPENSTICGYFTDFETGESISNVGIDFYTEDHQGNEYFYQAGSDQNGFYIVENVAAGYCIEYLTYAVNYHFFWGTQGFEIPENETIWLNISLYPYQPETTKICGYVIDNLTGECIINATIYTKWWDIHGRLSYNVSYSDENGFYTINLGPGCVWIETATEAYINQLFSVEDLVDYQTVWLNFSLDPEIIINIIKPKNGIYFENKMIFPFCFPLIIGPIDIEINVSFYGGDQIEYVELLIDGISTHNYTSEPLTYYWVEQTPFQINYKIEVSVHREEDSDASKELKVWKFF